MSDELKLEIYPPQKSSTSWVFMVIADGAVYAAGSDHRRHDAISSGTQLLDAALADPAWKPRQTCLCCGQDVPEKETPR